jgi:membrane dipeptidase
VVDKPFFVVDLAGPGQFRKLEQLLRAKGYGSARIEKIFGGNFLRVAGEVWGE